MDGPALLIMNFCYNPDSDDIKVIHRLLSVHYILCKHEDFEIDNGLDPLGDGEGTGTLDT